LFYLEYIIPEENITSLKDKYEQFKLSKSLMHLATKMGAEIDFYFKKGTEMQREMFDKMSELNRLGDFAGTINDLDLGGRIFSLLDSKIDMIGSMDPQTAKMLRNHYFPGTEGQGM
jgi:hypothetical protein